MDDNQKNIESLKEDFKGELNKKTEETNKIIASLKEDTQELSKKIDDSIEDSNKKIEIISQRLEDSHEKLNAKIGEEITEVRREVSEISERCEENQQEIQRAKETLQTRVNNIEESHLNKFEISVSYTHLDVYKRQPFLSSART